ncbi:hypothetical protein [Cupriavidus sp. YR651]|uniref:hypothetical protein n=1 Tax=Cupriavidus sp. YR651 TaxID=1855315 RepID=UPI000B869F32|nr:hypothetical protein [Cupriavidus sp. YR651]
MLALFFIGQARAQTQLHWDANGNIIGSSSQANIDQLTRDISAYNRARYPGAPQVVTLNGGIATMERTAVLEVGAGSGMGAAVKTAVIDVIKSPVSSLGKGIVNVARISPGGIAGTVAASLLLEAGISYLNGAWTKAGTPEQAPNGTPYPSTEYGLVSLSTGTMYGDGATLCKALIADRIKTGTGVATTYAGISVHPTTYGCLRQRVDNGVIFEDLSINRFTDGTCVQPGSTKVNGQCMPPGYAPAQGATPATDAQIESAITNGLGAHANLAPDVIKNIYDNGGWVPLDAVDAASWTIPSPTIQGKPSTKTTTGADGQTYTTTSTTTPTMKIGQTGNTAGDNALGYTVTNETTTTTKDSQGNTVGSGSSSEKPDYTFQDSDMPEVPKLYTQKYPDGLAGVWRDNKPNIQTTEFYQAVKTMFPSFGAGQCPVWGLSFNLGKAGNFGSRQFDVPCWIFQTVGLILMATAAFTARKIIF